MRTWHFFATLFLSTAPFVALADDSDDDFAVLPEPATLALLGAGVAALVASQRNRRK